MKKPILPLLGVALSMALLIVGCKQTPATLDAPKSVAESKAKLVGKSWKVKDVGIKSGMYSFSNSEEDKNTPIADWLSTSKEMGAFEKENLEKMKNFSMTLNADGTMKSQIEALGLIGKESFDVIQSKGDEEEKETIKIEFKADSSSVMEMSGVSFEYTILGQDDKNIILQTTNQINRQFVLLMLTCE